MEDETTTTFSHKTIFKDSAVLGTLIGVCLFIVIFILVLVLLAKFGYNPGSKLAQSKYPDFLGLIGWFLWTTVHNLLDGHLIV